MIFLRLRELPNILLHFFNIANDLRINLRYDLVDLLSRKLEAGFGIPSIELLAVLLDRCITVLTDVVDDTLDDRGDVCFRAKVRCDCRFAFEVLGKVRWCC